MNTILTVKATEAIGFEGLFRIKGGRTTYENVIYNCRTQGRTILLAKLDNTLKQTNRYVPFDTILEILEDPEHYFIDEEEPFEWSGNELS